MIDGFSFLSAHRARTMIVKPVTLQVFRGPAPSMQDE
jgi:hypothetical protein